MSRASQFKPLRTAAPDCLAQCKKCGAVESIDMVDTITESNLLLIHKDPEDPRFKDTPCGGQMKLYQEVRY